ncbi:unnamed protein product [Ambrosiozyma monospora]|uniref:Unnamed protein product n=1 Tax=Ambrosiozyma monospora TaxID=43982 RepID=A0ACB5U0Q3_AMBMO|nr:unnamed protein product [Ambrosiozyma monospora]
MTKDPVYLHSNNWKESLQEQVKLVYQIVSNGVIDVESKKILSDIYSIATSIAFITIERSSLATRTECISFNGNLAMNEYEQLLCERDASNIDLYGSNTQIPVQGSDGAQTLQESSSDKRPKGHGVPSRQRLSREVLLVLNEWFTQNEENPYLSPEDIKVLTGKTGLTSSQVKNWASNRRRKEKSHRISKEVHDILY